MRKPFHYFGDVNLEHGGYFYTTCDFKWNFSTVVRVQPCSDAGGPSNCFWIEHLTVNLPKVIEFNNNVILTSGISQGDFNKLTPVGRAKCYINAALGYGKYDQESSTMVRIGGPDEFFNGRHEEWEPSEILHANWTIKGYVKSKHLPEA
jgi:hypothetical protein